MRVRFFIFFLAAMTLPTFIRAQTLTLDPAGIAAGANETGESVKQGAEMVKQGKQLQDAATKIGSLKTSISELTQNIEKKKEELQKKITAKTERIKKMKEKIEAQAAEIKKKVEDAKETAQEKIDQAKDFYETGKGYVDEAKTKADEAKDLYEEGKAKVDEAQAMVNEANTEVETAQGEVNVAKAEVEETQAKFEMMSPKLSAVQDGVNKAQAKVNAAQSGYAIAESNFATAKTAAGGNMSSPKVISAKQQKDEAAVNLSAAKAELTQAENGAEEVAVEHSKAQKDLSAAEDKLIKAEGKLVAAEAKQVQAKDKLDAAKQNLSKFEKGLTNAEKEHAQAKENLKKLEADYVSAGGKPIKENAKGIAKAEKTAKKGIADFSKNSGQPKLKPQAAKVENKPARKAWEPAQKAVVAAEKSLKPAALSAKGDIAKTVEHLNKKPQTTSAVSKAVKELKTDKATKDTLPLQKTTPSRRSFKTSYGYGRFHSTTPLAFANAAEIAVGETDDGVLIVPDALVMRCKISYKDVAEKDGAFNDCLLSVKKETVNPEIGIQKRLEADTDLSNGYVEYLAAAFFEAMEIYNDSLTYKNKEVDPIITSDVTDVDSAWVYHAEMNQSMNSRVNNLNKLLSRNLGVNAYALYMYGGAEQVPTDEDTTGQQAK